ncbi:uncharacterized protein FOMMEDRAFT_167927 [Fomitiporia mediterranea MF3/22]|uniref:uncharacterized protein n=1 Tax=Fomitiporia mediterranea (strain MF3/22) TaxID=694068 RepID=UPI00044095BF|nr:uncharacterized protein FOMMEDRAFT_167927 [Fomitiporia mediterranea MF3/22]EJD02761.1 hypothetical protein FOMMEDRAFT_167927 [Fomitiporia mediterranea MF3/22]
MRSYVVAAFVFALLGAGTPVLSAALTLAPVDDSTIPGLRRSDQVLPKHACNGPRCASGVHLARQLDPVLALTALLAVPAVPTGAAGSTPTDTASTSTTDVTIEPSTTTISTTDVTIEPSTTTATDTVVVTATTTSFTSSTSLPTNMIVHHARDGAEFNLVSFGGVAGHYSGSDSATDSVSTTTTVVPGSAGTTSSSIESTETPGFFFKPLVRNIEEDLEDGSISVTANLFLAAASTKSSSVTDTVTSTFTPISATSSVEATTTVTSTVTDADSPMITLII